MQVKPMLNLTARPDQLFSFTYDGASSRTLLADWRTEHVSRSGEARLVVTTTWTDPRTGLRVTCEQKSFSDFPAVEWILYFENTGKADTPIIEDVQAMDLLLETPRPDGAPFVLHRTNGAPSNPSDFQPTTVEIQRNQAVTLSAVGGRSSNGDLPFFRIDTGRGPAVIAVGWSGQWKAQLQCRDDGNLRILAGMELTHFRLHPGEKVRSPRMLVMLWQGEEAACESRFRRLILKHYAARLAGKKPQPVLFCNTCFTRGGAWLNECNADNQISLIKALAPLGVQAVITDAGWFKGGWPYGAGNWDVDPERYPNGMGPVAAAAKACGMTYGLWFEPERVVAGTAIGKEHPKWVLHTKGQSGEWGGLLNFGLPEVQEYFFRIVEGYMKLPGFRVYRQDFNMDPLANWRDNDDPDRQGITEMKYIEGLYAYWDRIRQAFPDALMEECASGGRRIDLETVMRFQLHQKTDHWFDNTLDQASLFSLARFLPNSIIVAHLNRLDDYSFHSTMASSLCLGWIADDPKFDTARAKKLTARYLAVRPLLMGDWYPLTPPARDGKSWLASQYHRPDMGEGMILVFRQEQSPAKSLTVKLRGLNPEATYRVTSDAGSPERIFTGKALMEGLEIVLPDAPGSDIIVFRAEKRCAEGD